MASDYNKENFGDDFLKSTAAIVASGIAVLVAILISANLIVKHLRYYTCHAEQKWILRLIYIIPVYGIVSWLQLKKIDSEKSQIVLGGIRDCYEAFVIYSFLSLCLNGYLEGEAKVVEKLRGKPLPSEWKKLMCLLKGKSFSIYTLRFCKRATLQFCYVKIFAAILAGILYGQNVYHPRRFDLNDGYPYVLLLRNLSISIALWSLMLFYWCTREILAPHDPVLKFICIKLVIFFSFWQGVVLKFLQIIGFFGPSLHHGTAEGWQCFLTTCEILFAAIGFWFAFPYTHYVKERETDNVEATDAPGLRQFTNTLVNSIDVRDVWQDTVHNFSYRRESRSETEDTAVVDHDDKDQLV